MTPSEQARENVKYIRSGFIWVLQRVCLILVFALAAHFVVLFLINYPIAFAVLVVFAILVALTIFKAREDYWDDHKEYPKTGILSAKQATNTGPR